MGKGLSAVDSATLKRANGADKIAFQHYKEKKIGYKNNITVQQENRRCLYRVKHWMDFSGISSPFPFWKSLKGISQWLQVAYFLKYDSTFLVFGTGTGVTWWDFTF